MVSFLGKAASFSQRKSKEFVDHLNQIWDMGGTEKESKLIGMSTEKGRGKNQDGGRTT